MDAVSVEAPTGLIERHGPSLFFALGRMHRDVHTS